MIDNYDLFVKFLQEKNEIKPSLLLHACCGPCASSVLELLKDAFAITIYFYNPNIHPEEEYIKRLNEFKKLGSYPLISAPYQTNDYDEAIKGMENLGERSERCFACYKLRLEQTAILAKQREFTYFTTTLSLSPYKDSDKINELGQKLAEVYDVKFLYSNFKKNDGYKRSIELSKALGLYRQNYCGCCYSYQEMQKIKKL